MLGVPSLLLLLLLFALQVVSVVSANSGDNLVRKRREWILPPKPLMENVDYTKDVSIARIRSDIQSGTNVVYSLEGVGANQYPFNVFVVDPDNGNVRVTKILDREEIDTYNLAGVARFLNGTKAEKKIDLRIKVQDQNDNNPVFGAFEPVEIPENSPPGTSVTKVFATDADEPGNVNSVIAYTLIDQNPPGDMFRMNLDGTVFVKKSLDRETNDQYILTVQGQDLRGQSEGNIGRGTVTIKLSDVNDNPPTLEKEEFAGSIEENTYDVEVMRFKAEDLDLKGTENWETVFEIAEGNEAGYFSITTDPKTNEGVLKLVKPVDYEDLKNLDLGLAVRNKAPLVDGSAGGAGVSFGGGGNGASGGSGSSGASGASGSSGASGGSGGSGSSGASGGSWGSGSSGASGGSGGSGGSGSSGGSAFKTYPVKITVNNQKEGPQFDPKIKAIPISEGGNTFNMKETIARYTATDVDTGKPAENVRYVKGFDPDNWLTIDPETAEISLNKLPDRESPLLVNGTYYAQILCISEDTPAKTATGTIAIQVEDFNDHCPVLTSNVKTICTTQNSVTINAKDEDASPNGPPFEFTIVPEGTEGKWRVEHLNDTAVILRAQESIWRGFYEMELLVKDQQGKACTEPQKVRVRVCSCEDGVVCGKIGATGQLHKGAELGPAGIGLLLLGLLLLLLIPLLGLFCLCGNKEKFPDIFSEMPFDTKSHLISYHTEGQGDNTEVPTTTAQVCTNTVQNTVQRAPVTNLEMQQSVTSINGYNGVTSHTDGMWGVNNWDGSGIYSVSEGREVRGGGGIYDGLALSDHFLRQYYSQAAGGIDNAGVKDGLLGYDYEGEGSYAGSVGCCSLLESDDDLEFLDDLGLKFRTLAEICGGKKISNDMVTPLPSASVSSAQTSESKLVTAHQLVQPPMMQPTIPKEEQTIIHEIAEHSQMTKERMATVREGSTSAKTEMGNQSQIFLLQQQQQPVYYTTTPMLQPVHYVVQPQLQNTMVLAEAPATNLQDMVMVKGIETGPSQGFIVQGQTMMSSGQSQGPGTVLVGGSGIQGRCTNLIQAGNMSGSQTIMVVDGKVPAGSTKMLTGMETGLIQGGTLQSRELSGSQKVLWVGESASRRGQQVQETRGLLQKSDVSSLQRVVSSNGGLSTHSQNSTSSTTVGKVPTVRKVVVQETKGFR
ncbi:desmoglein-2.1-like [Odontesthes bonariensis]|uniref:desmoglein-2.1-like n=1 Tax=Odontesthes bonariensis TaxID=219752 RepID=UPI003F58107B